MVNYYFDTNFTKSYQEYKLCTLALNMITQIYFSLYLISTLMSRNFSLGTPGGDKSRRLYNTI